MKTILVIGAAKYLVVQLLLAIRVDTDAKCIAICGKQARFMNLSVLCAGYIETDFSGAGDDLFVERVNAMANAEADAVLMPADCAGARMINRVRDRIRTQIAAAPDTATLDRLDDKWQFYLLCRSLGLRVPDSRLVNSKFELDFGPIKQQFDVPFVVKPVSEDSGRGCCVVISEADFRKTIRDNPNYQYAPLIVQRFIPGQDVGLNFRAARGKVTAIAIQRRIYPDHDGSRIEFFPNQYLAHVAHTLAAATSYDGVMNVDARIEKETGDIFLFESNPRFWRSLSASVWNGLNFAAECMAEPKYPAEVRLLDSGSADTYYHPVFRPSLWKYVLFDRGHRGRMARFMMSDITILFASMRIMYERHRNGSSRWFGLNGDAAQPGNHR
jgi:predicted ATP-grasp superfamily ATP-dependent carboligase